MSHSKEVELLLHRAGWFPGRSVSIDKWNARPTPPFQAAAQILEEFGGLVIGEIGPGVNTARSDVDFRPQSWDEKFQPDQRLEGLVGERLYPVAIAHGNNYQLWVAESGRLYLEAEFEDGSWIKPIGATIEEALDRLLLGKRAG